MNRVAVIHANLRVFRLFSLLRGLELSQLAGRACYPLALVDNAIVTSRATGLLFTKKIDQRQYAQGDSHQ